MATERSRNHKRGRYAKLIALLIFLIFAITVTWFFDSQSTTTVILVRHAEKATEPADDPALSPEGRRRAERLAEILASVDVVSGVDVIYATQYRRTQETGRPLATRLELPIVSVDADDVAGLVKRIQSKDRGKIVLVIGHSNTVPQYIREFGGSKKIKPIDESEYYHLFIVTIPWQGKTKTLHLRY